MSRGWGPPPKPADQRARRNKDPITTREIAAQPSEQPPLPEGVQWPDETRSWWQMWGDSPLSDDFTPTDWSELVTTARLHAAVVRGELKYAAELRLRVAKYGATPEDRLRLRIQFVAAEEAEQNSTVKAPSVRTDRYQGLRSVGKSTA